MKRREIKSTSLLFMVLLALMVTACGKNTDIATGTVKEEPKTEGGDEMKGYKEENVVIIAWMTVSGSYDDTEHVSPAQTQNPDEYVTEPCFPIPFIEAI